MIEKHFLSTRSVLAATVLAGLFAVTHTQAQPTYPAQHSGSYTGPVQAHEPYAADSAGGYRGPATAVSSVRYLLEQGRDDQRAVLRGRLVSRDGKKHYTFDDGTAQIRVEIKDKHFPFGQIVSDTTQVELFGELERKSWGRVEFEVDMMRVL